MDNDDAPTDLGARMAQLESTQTRILELLAQLNQNAQPAPAPQQAPPLNPAAAPFAPAPPPAAAPGLRPARLWPNPPAPFLGDHSKGRHFLAQVRRVLQIDPEGFLDVHGNHSDAKLIGYALSFMEGDTSQSLRQISPKMSPLCDSFG